MDPWQITWPPGGQIDTYAQNQVAWVLALI